ncbi:hypothetical protein [Thermococcus sp.]|uniref:hypothetical protein n=1 Tax=Thermococcus sp. TaxID=35749 RepID=UPI0026239836|nr:hypothetical protein [Thermococcus sp.]
MRQTRRVRLKPYKYNFELQTLFDIIRLLNKVKVSYQAEMARYLGIERQTMNEYFYNIILPLARKGVFIVKPNQGWRWGEPRYFILLAPDWKKALCEWIAEEVEG